MEDFKKNAEKDRDIIFSKTIRAGKRIYYIDVKKNKREELYLAITESKRIQSADAEGPFINFEKHKIFLYREDMEHFAAGLDEAIEYIHREQPETMPEEERHTGEIDIDIEF